MRKRFWVAMLATFLATSGFLFTNVSAINPTIVISQIQLGNTVSASNELIEIYNNSTVSVEITNWCLYYASATSSTQGSKLGCFTPENDLLHIYLPSHTYALAISTVMATNNPTLASDLKFSATLSGTAGHVRLMNNLQVEVDKVGWGTTAISPETAVTATAPNGKLLQRKILSSLVLQDTDNNATDFELAIPRTSYVVGALYEVQDICSNIEGIQQDLPSGYSLSTGAVCSPPPVDLCVNLDGLQVTMPTHYVYDERGMCQFDVCPNIDNLQLVIPDGKEIDMSGNCIDHDYCLNIEGVQIRIPENYIQIPDDMCMLQFLPITISELLPNAIGDDTGHEYIELYNPNDIAVTLTEYRLSIGVSTIKVYPFPTGATIQPHSYYDVSNDDVHFTLVNTSGSVALISSDNQAVDGPVYYTDPIEGVAWALIATVWQYTDQPTPAQENLPSVVQTDDVEEVVTGLKPCAPNQYRNPETNRCRQVITIGSTLSACKVGQYRSEETNRCRSIASDAVVLGECNADQERNPATNRCRLITSSAVSLAPCKDNQERNVDTNRCRTVVTTVPPAAFAVEPVADTADAFVGWWALGGIGLLALMYAGWEWRVEIVSASRKLVSFFHRTK